MLQAHKAIRAMVSKATIGQGLLAGLLLATVPVVAIKLVVDMAQVHQ